MTENQEQKVLLALDGSERSFEVIRYISRTGLFHETRLTLFSVYDDIPEFYYDMGDNPQLRQAVSEITVWKHQQKRDLEAFMAKAVSALVDSGIAKKNITVEIQNKRVGIARDIIRESHQEGYSAVFVGRKGEGMMKELFLGSVAEKLLEKIEHIPLVLVGRDISDTRKVLLALDTSDMAARLVNFAAANFTPDYEIGLFHVIRGHKSIIPPELQTSTAFATYTNARKQAIEAVFDEAGRRLAEAGFSAGRITRKVVMDKHSRAENIVREAEQNGYGTVVLGRRGVSRIQEFVMGRVGNKVLQLSRKTAVWVIN